MNPWPFVIAAYALTIAATVVMLLASWRDMRAAERAADEMRKSR